MENGLCMSEIAFWAPEGAEQLVYTTLDEAIEDFVSTFMLPGGAFAEDMPETVVMQGFARMEPELRRGDTVARVLEWLDEEFGDPDGGATLPTPAMLHAEEKLHEAILQDYTTWACEQVDEKTIDVRQWIAEDEARRKRGQ